MKSQNFAPTQGLDDFLDLKVEVDTQKPTSIFKFMEQSKVKDVSFENYCIAISAGGQLELPVLTAVA